MSVSKILNTDGTYTARNNYFGAYVAFHDSCYDYDDNSTYVIAEKTDGSLTLLRTQDDGGTFEDLGLVGVTPAPVANARGETTFSDGMCTLDTLVAGGGIVSFCVYLSGTVYNQYIHSTTDPFTNAWTKESRTAALPMARARMGDLYLEINTAGISTAATADYAAPTQRQSQASVFGYGGIIGIAPDGTARAAATAYVYASADGINWTRTALSTPTGFTGTTDKRPHVGAVHSNDFMIAPFHSTNGLYNGMLIGTNVGAAAQRRDAIGTTETTSPTNIALSVSYDEYSDTFFATTQHKTTSALSYWKYTVLPQGLPAWTDWSLVTTEGAPSDSTDSPTQSAVMTVLA